MATHAHSTRVSAREVMSRAWANYRASFYARGPFNREAFGWALAMAWSTLKALAHAEAERARREAEEEAELAAMAVEDDAEPSAVEQEIAMLSYMPLRMSTANVEAAIRARYAEQGIYA